MKKMTTEKMMMVATAREENMKEVIFDLMKERDELKELISKQDEVIDTQHNLIRSLEKENELLSELVLFKEVAEYRKSSVDYDLDISTENSVRDNLRIIIGAIIDSRLKSGYDYDFDFNVKEICYLHSLFMSGKRK